MVLYRDYLVHLVSGHFLLPCLHLSQKVGAHDGDAHVPRKRGAVLLGTRSEGLPLSRRGRRGRRLVRDHTRAGRGRGGGARGPLIFLRAGFPTFGEVEEATPRGCPLLVGRLVCV